jgi:hypothetical protein
VDSQHRGPLLGFVSVAVLSGFFVGRALHTQSLVPDDGAGRPATTASASPSEPGTASADPSASGGVAGGGVAGGGVTGGGVTGGGVTSGVTSGVPSGVTSGVKSGPGDPTTHAVVKSIGDTPVLVPADGDSTLGAPGSSSDPSTGGNGAGKHGGGGVQARVGGDPNHADQDDDQDDQDDQDGQPGSSGAGGSGGGPGGAGGGNPHEDTTPPEDTTPREDEDKDPGQNDERGHVQHPPKQKPAEHPHQWYWQQSDSEQSDAQGEETP